ncbi:MAG: B12-binding domain-containing radical SAM protein [Planctomycetes bacterium]|nr:B12-binding domain-containing radical SAM protein [Planctomycetota bacterium]
MAAAPAPVALIAVFVNVLVIDLNNFGHYPTIGLGYLVAALRSEGIMTSVLSPLALGVAFNDREPRPTWTNRLENRIYHSTRPTLVAGRRMLTRMRVAWATRTRRRIVREASRLVAGVDVVLVSSYLEHRDVCGAIGRSAQAQGVPMIVGGQAFTDPAIAAQWLELPGLAVLVGAESEPFVAELVKTTIEGGDLSAFPGAWLPDGRRGPAPVPLTSLDEIPFPDYDDFPWNRYERPIIPMLAARGCSHGVCAFCSDVLAANGRGFRPRRAAAVLQEMEHQAERYQTSRFLFVDLKLNGDLDLWRGLHDGIPTRIPDAQWAGAVHVDGRTDNGLGLDDLRAARCAGLVRLTTGVESGSAAVLQRMHKGTDLDRTAGFLERAKSAGISVRVTLITGYPEEGADDLEATVGFVRSHRDRMDRVQVNRFAMQIGTEVHRDLIRNGSAFPDIRSYQDDPLVGVVRLRSDTGRASSWRRAHRALLTEVDAINERPLSPCARAFEGYI